MPLVGRKQHLVQLVVFSMLGDCTIHDCNAYSTKPAPGLSNLVQQLTCMFVFSIVSSIQENHMYCTGHRLLPRLGRSLGLSLRPLLHEVVLRQPAAAWRAPLQDSLIHLQHQPAEALHFQVPRLPLQQSLESHVSSFSPCHCPQTPS